MFGAIPIQPPSRSPCGRCLWPYGVALSSAPWLAAALVPLLLCRGAACSGGADSGGLRWMLRRAWRSAKVAGKVAKVAGMVVRLRAKVAGIVAVKVASTCAKVAHLPQNHSRFQNSVYKGGIFVAHFPKVDGKSCKSRSLSAHFTSKSLASMYFC